MLPISRMLAIYKEKPFSLWEKLKTQVYFSSGILLLVQLWKLKTTGLLVQKQDWIIVLGV